MKILKIFGVVVGIHVFALILIFANPGCSSAKRPVRDGSETVIASGDDTVASAPASRAFDDSPISAAPIGTTSAPPSTFDPNAPAAAVRFSPTRPGTPAAATLEAAPVTDVTPASTYTVVKGDSLWTIARRQNSTVAEIAAANNLKTNATVRVGQKLIIPAKSYPGSTQQMDSTATATPVTASAPRASRETMKHVVRPGETLGAIARKFQVTVADIATANNIADPARITAGMELTIPGWQAPASRATRTPAPVPTAPASTPNVSAPEPTPDSVPTVILPAPEQDLDSGLRSKSGEPPVIQVEDQ